MSFDYGENGSFTSSPKTLYSIKVYCEGPTTPEIAQMKSELNEKTPAKPNHEGEYYSVSDSPEGGNHVTIGAEVPEDTMDYIEETVYSDADNDLGAEIVNVVNDYLSGESPTPYQVLVIPHGGTVLYKSMDGKEIAKSTNEEILALAEENKCAMGYITYTDYDDHDGDILVYRVTIRVSRSIPGITSQDSTKKEAGKADQDDEYYSVTDSAEGGKHVSMDVIIPEDGDADFDFCTYECRISDQKQIDIITKYMKRYEECKEPRPFLMIGRPCFGLDNLDIFYSLDGEIIFNFIFDEKIKDWIREAGFVLGKVKSYKPDSLFTDQLSVTLSVSKRKNGETLFKLSTRQLMMRSVPTSSNAKKLPNK